MTAGLALTEHEFSVPLRHDRPDRERITVFAREVADPDGRERPILVFEEYAALAPLREAAEILAGHGWPPLYDPVRLRDNEVPVAAVIYAEDMYVERALSEGVAAEIRGLRPWLTNEFEHNGLRVDGARILGRLIDLARGRA